MVHSAFQELFHPIHAEKNHTYLYSGRVFILLFLLIWIPGCSGDMIHLCIPKEGTLWNGAFSPVKYHLHEMDITNESIRSYVNSSGKNLAVIAFSHEWSINRSFPIEKVQMIHANGAIPYIRLMLRSDNNQYRPEPLFTLKRIFNGIYDRDLIKFARTAKRMNFPIVIEYGTEVNGWWFSWNGYWTGKEKGAELFRSVYRHIITLMREEGADNLIWVYHINWHSNPEEDWNTPEAYYPGDEYIDLIGVSAYGALSPNEDNILPFSRMMDEGYAAAQNLSVNKSVLISEMGTDLRNPHKPASIWIDEAFSAIINEQRWPGVIGFVWWNAGWPNDNNPVNNTTMRIEDDREVQKILQRHLSSDQVLSAYC